MGAIDQSAMNFINQHNALKIANTNAAINKYGVDVTKYGIDTRADLTQQDLNQRKKLFDLVTLPKETDRQWTQTGTENIANVISKESEYMNQLDKYNKAIEEEKFSEGGGDIGGYGLYDPNSDKWFPRLRTDVEGSWLNRMGRYFGRTFLGLDSVEEEFKDMKPEEIDHVLENMSPQDILQLRKLGIGSIPGSESSNTQLLETLNSMGINPGYLPPDSGGIQE